ncbi:hypothetical protein DFH07DRAFT_778362 [Mycena maculata]|uniref:Uncharacterized protein n=1 Tax=Mycena maculata TaxID=230809 RepID=A0AAD7IEX6_9AGAR|nr:hypothetical protein DFH07DRAFT_778362 [Mycena maculata]
MSAQIRKRGYDGARSITVANIRNGCLLRQATLLLKPSRPVGFREDLSFFWCGENRSCIHFIEHSLLSSICSFALFRDRLIAARAGIRAGQQGSVGVPLTGTESVGVVLVAFTYGPSHSFDHCLNLLKSRFQVHPFNVSAAGKYKSSGVGQSLSRWIKFGKAGAANWNGHIDGQDHKDADKAAKSAGQTALLSEPERVSASVRAHAKKKMIVLSDEEMEEKSCCVPNCTMTEPNLPMVACSGPACDSQVHLCCVGSKAKDNIPPPEWFCDDDYGNA